jgi:hypothetical protein
VNQELTEVMGSRASVAEKLRQILQILAKPHCSPPAVRGMRKIHEPETFHTRCALAVLQQKGWEGIKHKLPEGMKIEQFTKLRNDAIAEITKFCVEYLRSLGYEVTFTDYGSRSENSDVDVVLVPGKGQEIPEEIQMMAVLLFGAYWHALFETPSGRSMDVECYMPHLGASDSEPFSTPEAESEFLYLEILFGSLLRVTPTGLEDGNPILTWYRDVRPKMSEEERQELLVNLSKSIDSLKRELLTTEPGIKRDRILLDIYIAYALRNTMLPESYIGLGPFRMACSLDGGQLQARAIEKIQEDREPTQEDVISLRRRFPTPIEGIASLFENTGMEENHRVRCIVKGETKAHALIHTAKYSLRSFQAANVVLFSGEVLKEDPNVHEFMRLHRAAQSLERCKRGKQLSDEAFAQLLYSELVEIASKDTVPVNPAKIERVVYDCFLSRARLATQYATPERQYRELMNIIQHYIDIFQIGISPRRLHTIVLAGVGHPEQPFRGIHREGVEITMNQLGLKNVDAIDLFNAQVYTSCRWVLSIRKGDFPLPEMGARRALEDRVVEMTSLI